jgi:hypothetical protein
MSTAAVLSLSMRGQFTSPISPISAYIAMNLETGHDLSPLKENFDMQMGL